MKQSLVHVALLVREYDEAIQFYVQKLGFRLVQDIPLEPGKRWVLVAPPNGNGTALLLARAVGKNQINAVGNQTGGRVFLFLQTDDFQRDYRNMKKQGVSFLETPRSEPYGQVVVFQDLYGNKWDLLQYHRAP